MCKFFALNYAVKIKNRTTKKQKKKNKKIANTKQSNTKMSLEIPESSPKQKKKKYQQKFCKKWINDPSFSSWLEEKDGIPFCSVCNRYFREGTCRNELDRHLKTSIHEDNLQKVRMEICRICLLERNVNYMPNIYEDDPETELKLYEQINLVGGINIPKQSMPDRICLDCKKSLKDAYKFRVLCKRSAKRFPNLFQEVDVEKAKEPDLDSLVLEENLKELLEEEEQEEEEEQPPVEEAKEDLGKDENCFMCDVCGQQFDKKYRLSNHIRWHMKIRPYKCDSCDKSFAQKCDLKSHFRVHTGEKPFTCSMCNKSFSSLSAKQCHERTHRNERPYKCDICEKTFTYGSTLNKHKRTHTGEKNYICELCNKAFAEGHHLKAHLQTNVHNDNLKKYSEEGEEGDFVEGEYEYFLE